MRNFSNQTDVGAMMLELYQINSLDYLPLGLYTPQSPFQVHSVEAPGTRLLFTANFQIKQSMSALWWGQGVESF